MRTVFLSFAIVLPFMAACGTSSSEAPSIASITEQETTNGEYAYSFDRSGVMTSAGTRTASYSISRDHDTLTAGSNTYRFDPLGRVVAIDNVSITYGPHGQIAQAVSGGRTVSYVYDENGQRILKRTNGAATAAYIDEGYLTAAGLEEPVHVAGKLVGLLKNGQFALTAADVRGTVIADTDGTSRLPSPFGARPVAPDVAAAVDYAEKGLDEDLGVIRMGVRDYDPRIGRFLTPDPLFLEHPERCVGHFVDCNLYSYARNSPALIVDPDGTDGVEVSDRVTITVPGGYGVTAKIGLVVDLKKPLEGVKVNAGVGQATPSDPATSAKAVAATAGGTISYVKDPSKITGSGTTSVVTAPVYKSPPLAGTFTRDKTASGEVNAVGVGLSVGTGAGESTMRTTTVDVTRKTLDSAVSSIRKWAGI
jgi:RHS repeat-associated protein